MTRERAIAAPVSRRRFIVISAVTAAAGLVAVRGHVQSYRTFSWRGVALGAHVTLTLEYHDEAAAKSAIAACLAEVARLESIFSLHRPESALSRLNLNGRLDEAPADLRTLLAEARALAERTHGAFDPTVQPLWELYARHFRTTDSAPEGPSETEIAETLKRIGWGKIAIDGAAIRLAEPGMALTLNGIAQGYITDKIGELLRSRGFEHVLVDAGEQLAVGPKWDGSSWLVGIASPFAPGGIVAQFPLSGGAVATSGTLGNTFDPAGRLSHILDPRTGRPAASWASVSVFTDRATLADGLSTALSVVTAAEAPALLGSGCRAFAVAASGESVGWI